NLHVREGRRHAGRKGGRPVPRHRRAAESLRPAEGVRHSSATRYVRGCHGGAVMALLLALVSAFVIGIGLVMAVYVGITKLPEYMAQRKLQGRLEELSAPIDEKPDAKTLVKISEAGPLPALERMISGTARGSAFSRWIEQSGMKISISGVLLIATFFAIVCALLVTMLTRSPLGIPVGAAIGFSLPFMFLKFKRTRRLRAFEEMFPEALDLIARALKAGH